MDRTERFYKIDHLLRERGTVTTRELLDELEVSLATLKRDLEYMKSRHHAPIEWDRDAGGYRLVQPLRGAPAYELPGLWFNAGEAEALLTMQQLLESLEPGVAKQLAPFKARLEDLLATPERSGAEVRRRIRVAPLGARPHQPKHFELIATAVLRRKRLELDYWNRMRDETTSREVSPQRLVHYRGTWYLDAWCHLRRGLRSFGLDAMRGVRATDTPAIDVAEEELKAVLGSGYGIFSGKEVQWAKLRFSPERGRYVAMEKWHSRQKARWEEDGRYVLEIPYSSDKELALDICRFAGEVEVLAPDSLRKEVARRGAALARQNEGSAT